MAENKVDWTNFSFAQRFFRLEQEGSNISHSVTPIGVGGLPPSVTPQILAAQLANPLKAVGQARKIIEDDLFEPEDRPAGNAYLEDLAYFIAKGASRIKKEPGQ